jgi:autotransporter-associated beta strand protein
MTQRVKIALGFLASLAGLLVCPSSATAQTQYYWDATSPITAIPGSGGSGNWNTNAGNTVWFVSGGSDSVWANGNIANFAGTAGTVTVNTAVTADGLTFITAGYIINGGSALSLTSATITLPSGGIETINCPIAGTTTVTVSPASGSGTLMLGGTNTYTGATTINSGATLTIGGAGELGSGTYAGAITDNGAYIYNSSAAQTNSGTISGTGTLTQAGPGTLTLTKGNTYSGGTTINSTCTLALTSVPGAGAGTMTNNGTLNVTTAAASFLATIVGGASSVMNINIPYTTASENIRYDGPTTLTGFTGTINLIAGLSAGQPGAGQIIMTNNGASTCTWNIGSGATLDLATGTGASPYSANVILNGPGNSQPYGALRLDAVTLLGNVLLNGTNITIGDDSTTAASQMSGVISDGGQHFGFTRIVSGKTIILSGANTYTGATVFSAGTLQANSAEIPGTSGPFGASPAANPGNIVLSGGTLQYSSVNSNDYSGRFSTNAGQAYNIDLNGQTVTFATPLTSSAGALTLADTAGGGTLTLSGANTFNGITTISSGTLNIAGSIAGTAINVNGGALQLDKSTALPAGTILTLPGSPGSGMVNLNFSGVQNITVLNFGANNPLPSGTYGSLTNTNVQNQNPAFIGNGILNVEPPTYWDPGFSASGSGSGGTGNWNSTATNWFIGTNDTKWESNNIANFAGTAGTVTLTANQTADGIMFETSGYDITNNGGAGVLTLGGTPIISVPNGNTAEMDCVLAGTAGLTEAGSGTLTLTGSNTFTGAMTISSGCALVLSGANAYAGATTINSGSTLTLTNAGDLGDGSYPGAIVNTGSFTYASSASQTLSGIISGSGPLIQDGPGALTLGGFNTFNGSITINNSTLILGGAGDLNNNPTFNTGSYSGAMSDNGAFIYNSTSQQTITSGINGTGTLTQSGAGTLTLSGQNNYGGTTTIGSNSDLIISGSGTLGFGDYATNIIDNGTFNYDSSSPQTLAGLISGTGMLILEGSGPLTLTDTNIYTGATTIDSGGNLTISGSGDLGNGSYAANITNGGTFIYNSSTSQILSGVLSGAGTLDQQGPGSLTLMGANSYTGGTSVASGCTLTISGSGDLGKGSYAGSIDDAGTLIYNSSAAQTLSGVISDSGSLTQSGSGRLTLSGELDYSGGTTISSGSVLIISGDAVLGFGDYETNLINNGTFVDASSFQQNMGGVISGSGALLQVGSGGITLTDTNTYTGATVISNGTLALSGSGSISNSTLISISAGGTFDVSALASPYIFTGANLSASGTAAGGASINGASGGVVNMGSQLISLTFAPQTFNGDATHPALNITQGALTLNGNVVTVNNAGASPLGVGTYSLIQVAGGTLTGSAKLGGVVTGAGLAANTGASLSVAGGSLNLVVATVVVPGINSITFSGGKLIFSGTNGPDSGTYYVLTSTNLALPLSSWTSIATNTFSPTGTFSATNTVSTNPSFFVIKVHTP